MNELKTKGKCLFCNETFVQKEISKHLNSHLAVMEKKEGKNSIACFHIVVSVEIFFLNLLVRGDATMKIIDLFLREIWLECCGHLSDFKQGSAEIKMSRTISQVFPSKKPIYHTYDYGTSTVLELNSVATFKLNQNDPITLLSRNEPPEVYCAICNKQPAVCICTNCMYDEPAFFCEKCSTSHAKKCEEFEDYRMSIFNSPRAGMCGYEGGRIDLEREGVFVLNKKFLKVSSN